MGLDQKLMSEYFKEAGYSTHLVGKWHLGFYREQYTPTRRGFDTYHGFYSPWTDYYSSTFYMGDRNYSRGLDLRRNLVVDRNQNGQYATDMYTQDVIDIIENHDKDKPMFLLLTHLAPHAGNDDDPLQAKPEDIAKFAHITAPQPPQRQVYAAMVHALDESIGKIVESLTNSGLMEDTILVFYSDNGVCLN
jgi:arylsulfatase A-like enzyme